MDFDKIKAIRSKMKEKKPMPGCSVVIVAAGSSQRMGSDKLLADLCGKPVLARSIQAFEDCELVNEIVVVTRSDRVEEIADLCSQYAFRKVSKVISGGATRTESALAGVSEVSPKSGLIAIHDGARPLVTVELIRTVVIAARDYLSAVPVIASVDTLKTVDDKGLIVGTVDRSRTVRVQTPQVFSADHIKGALTHAVSKNAALTDDCSAMEAMGIKTFTVEGDPDNIKITVPRDLILAEAILRGREN